MKNIFNCCHFSAFISLCLPFITASVILITFLVYVADNPVEAKPNEQHKTERINSDLVVVWNARAVEISYAEDQFFKFKGHRALTMMHLAMHDVLNRINPQYEPYACSGRESGAEPIAAASQAAYQILVAQYPDRQTLLENELKTWLDQIPRSEAKQAGIELGTACADKILRLREDDGWDTEGDYEFRDKTGDYMTTGSWDGYVHAPGFRSARPFVLKTHDQFRSLPPPALESRAYAEAFNEVKMYGEAKSRARTEDQTGYAIWWMEFAEAAVNRLARQLAESQKLDLQETARLFAYINVALYDTYIAVWDAKYEYNHWRPVTAILRAEEDGNPNTAQDVDWKPLRPTAPFPDYPSAHAAACAASFGVLEQIFGTDFQFEMETNTAPKDMPTRSFNSFDEAAKECADSRIQLGWHFRYAADEGLVLGRSVKNFIIKNQLYSKSNIEY